MPPSAPAGLDRLRTLVHALRAKTIDNGCTEDEALSAAAKVAELLDRYDLSLTDVEIQEASCDRIAYTPRRNKRMPLDECIGAVAAFCDCRAWREKTRQGEISYVFFGLPADIAAAHGLIEMIDTALRSDLGRYKTSGAYGRLRHQDRALANTSFLLGMAASIADRLDAMKQARDGANRASGRDLVLVKTSIVDAELGRLDLALTVPDRRGRLVSPSAYAAGGLAGDGFAVTRGTGTAAVRR